MTLSKLCLLALLPLSTIQVVFSQPASSYVSRTVAGAFAIGDNGPAISALLESPPAVAADASGNLYIADSGNGAIRKVSRNGVITSLIGYSGRIYDLKLDSAGNLYIAGGNYAYKLTPAGVLTAIAGNGSFTAATGDGGPATSAGFNGLYALAAGAAEKQRADGIGADDVAGVSVSADQCRRKESGGSRWYLRVWPHPAISW
jgi:hypothetical protein